MNASLTDGQEAWAKRWGWLVIALAVLLAYWPLSSFQYTLTHGDTLNCWAPEVFYDKAARKVITCNAPHGVQYIRDRIHSPGALAGGSSYVNLLDGDAQTVAFTVATREKRSVYRRLGGTRMGLLMLLHPIRMARMVLQGAFEWLLEEWERARGELAGRATHSEGIFPLHTNPEQRHHP